ncbi:MAG: TOBE domain-containing protein [Candidatus Heimdallarchaeota archaeon]
MSENEQEGLKKLLVTLNPRAKVWLEYKGEALVGPGRADLLEAILQEGSLVHAAKKRNISFRAAWERIRKIEHRLKIQIAKSKKGGEGGGGTTLLTEMGRRILRRYKRLETAMEDVLSDPELMEVYGMKISAKNKLKGTIQDIEQVGIIAKIKIQVKQPLVITSIINTEAIEELNLKEGDTVNAIIKSTEVLIGKD